MIKAVYDTLPEILRTTCTLEESSKDSEHKTSMSNSSLKVVDFDKIPKKYAEQAMIRTVPKSNDALYITKENKWIFIEFKNGEVKKEEIYRKLYDSLIMLEELAIKDWNFFRNHATYILVYNEDVYCQRNAKLQKSKNRDVLYQHIRNRANTVRNLYEIRKLEGFLFENAWTYNEEQFAEFFEKRYETEEAGEVCVS